MIFLALKCMIFFYCTKELYTSAFKKYIYISGLNVMAWLYRPLISIGQSSFRGSLKTVNPNPNKFLRDYNYAGKTELSKGLLVSKTEYVGSSNAFVGRNFVSFW